ncbi:DUF433 domain-containing protein [Lamprocystis purpurea]|uniref:DUF433 domain-containing protein n=1 Tax=Lamprocystis purpurea TaxID=61598 RepID=UPI0004765CC0|nr:DUF433 domain-containing protein [Lamprocystis purpurea]
MKQDDLLQRITSRPDVFGGKPIVRDLRISVELVLSLLAQGESSAAILEDYPDLDQADINACLAVGTERIRISRMPPDSK